MQGLFKTACHAVNVQRSLRSSLRRISARACRLSCTGLSGTEAEITRNTASVPLNPVLHLQQPNDRLMCPLYAPERLLATLPLVASLQPPHLRTMEPLGKIKLALLLLCDSPKRRALTTASSKRLSAALCCFLLCRGRLPWQSGRRLLFPRDARVGCRNRRRRQSRPSSRPPRASTVSAYA